MLKSANIYYKTPKLLVFEMNSQICLYVLPASSVKTLSSNIKYETENNFSEYVPAQIQFWRRPFKNTYFLEITILKMIAGRKYISN